MSELKNNHFEYLVDKLSRWYSKNQHIPQADVYQGNNDLSKLKLLKLHFFVCAINSKSNSLLEVFDNFVAMPYGHVELDLYNAINNNELKAFRISSDSLTKIGNIDFNINATVKIEIDKAVNDLQSENQELITADALDLVDLSHNWFSWQSMFGLARKENRYIQEIPQEIIKYESKIFSFI